jgi:hypothetical protein
LISSTRIEKAESLPGQALIFSLAMDARATHLTDGSYGCEQSQSQLDSNNAALASRLFSGLVQLHGAPITLSPDEVGRLATGEESIAIRGQYIFSLEISFQTHYLAFQAATVQPLLIGGEK